MKFLLLPLFVGVIGTGMAQDTTGTTPYEPLEILTSYHDFSSMRGCCDHSVVRTTYAVHDTIMLTGFCDRINESTDTLYALPFDTLFVSSGSPLWYHVSESVASKSDSCRGQTFLYGTYFSLMRYVDDPALVPEDFLHVLNYDFIYDGCYPVTIHKGVTDHYYYEGELKYFEHTEVRYDWPFIDFNIDFDEGILNTNNN